MTLQRYHEGPRISKFAFAYGVTAVPIAVPGTFGQQTVRTTHKRSDMAPGGMGIVSGFVSDSFFVRYVCVHGFYIYSTNATVFWQCGCL